MLYVTSSVVGLIDAAFIFFDAAFSQFVAFAAPIYFILLFWRGLSWRDIGIHKVSTRPVVNRLVRGAVDGALLVIPVAFIAFVFDITSDTGWVEVIADHGISWKSLMPMLALVGILLPFVEEVLFRGVIYSWMRTHWPSSVAIAMNAALFGLAHIFYPPAFVILVGVLGAIFALAFERTGAGYNSALVTAVYLSLAV